MKDLTLKVRLGIIALNLTVQTVKDVGLFTAAYAGSAVQQAEICDYHLVGAGSFNCARLLTVS